MAKNEDIRIGNDQVEEALRQGIAAADPERAAGLSLLISLTQARDAGLVREQTRLRRSATSGDRLEAITRRLDASVVLNRAIDSEIKRMDRRPPRPNPDVWTLQGAVLVDDPKILLDKSVALCDEKGSKLEGSESDLDDGKFEITYHLEQPKTRPPRAQARASQAAQQAHDEETKEDPAGTNPSILVFLCISDQGRVVYRDPQPLKAANGVGAYVEIDLTTLPAVRTARERAAEQPAGNAPEASQKRQSRRTRGSGEDAEKA